MKLVKRVQAPEAMGPTLLPRKDGKLLQGRLILMAVFVALLVLAATRPFLLLTDAIPHEQAVNIRLWAYVLTLTGALIGAFIDKGFKRLNPVPIPIIAFLTWCALSTFWSNSVIYTLQKLVISSCVIWIIFICVNRIGSRRAVLVFQIVLSIFMILNYLAVMLDPVVGIHDYGTSYSRGWWKGVMSHKNIAGTVAAFTALFCGLYGHRSTIVARQLIVVASLVFLYFTQSKTSMIGVVASFVVGIVILLYGSRLASLTSNITNLRRQIAYPVFAFILVVISLIVTLQGDALLWLAHDPSLFTGRGQIWQAMLLYYVDHPFLGSGFGAFWISNAGTSTIPHDASRFSGLSQGHSGYLDLAVQVGLPGLIISIWAVVVFPTKLAIRSIKIDKPLTSLSVAVLIFFIINNFSESSMFEGDQIPQVAAMFAIASLSTKLRRAHGQDDGSIIEHKPRIRTARLK
jgi:exopolysaccharide production protein ExoQ